MTESEKNALQAQIAALPKGNITYKSISGKKYPYLQKCITAEKEADAKPRKRSDPDR